MRSMIFCVFLLVSATTFAAGLSSVEIYKRCYIRMTRQIPNPADARLAQVANGSLNPVTACMQLFDRAAFDNTGTMVNRSDAEARRIVKTFNDFSLSYFSNKVNTDPATMIVRDWEEPALYITRATFQPNVNFSTIVTMNSGLQGTRDIIGAAPATKFQAQNIFMYYPAGIYKLSTDYNVTYVPSHAVGFTAVADPVTTYTFPGATALIDVGQLVGVRAQTPLPLPNYAGDIPMAAYRNGSAGTPGGVEAANLAAGSFDVNAHMGATGILGSQVFYMNNTNTPGGTLVGQTDLYSNLPRRVTRKVEEDLLCHQLPTLLPSDADVLADLAAFKSDNYPFHHAIACLQCHSSIDASAFAYRNVYLANTYNQGPGASIAFAARLPVVAGSTYVSLQPANKENYSKFVYRSNVAHVYNSTPIASLEDLATAVSNSDDLYSCAAKKYYRFFTGIDVDLSAPALAGSVAAYHQNLVLKFGKDLKTSQSVRSLINEIVSSVPFQTRDYQSAGSN